MKKNIIYLLTALLFLAVACEKDPIDIPSPPTSTEPQVKKYLAKVSWVRNDGNMHYDVVRCTWDSLQRLKIYTDGSGDHKFYYDSLGRVSRIELFFNLFIDGPKGYYYFCFDWKNEKEVNGVDRYRFIYGSDTTYTFDYRYTYFYDRFGRFTKIVNLLGNDPVYQVKWNGLNITEAGTQDSPFFVDNQKFDNKHSPWSVMPNIFNIGHNAGMLIKLLYNPSKNNPLQGNGFFPRGYNAAFEYDYDKDGYPIRQYYLEEDGSKKLEYVFEYYE